MNTIIYRKKRLSLMAHKIISVITLIFFCAGNVFALPAGQQVINGQASFITQSNNLTVTSTPNAIINWQGFSINNNEAVRFIQQYASSSVLNRVTGQDPSRILGLLQSNGRVFLVNPNGILFGQGARIDVNGLFASTLAINNQDFLAGKFNFSAGAVAGAIQNQGTITTPEGGKVYLIAPDIENSGIINTPRGDVLLAAGHSVSLVDSLNPDIAVVVSAPENKAVNLGQIVAQSGKVGIYGGLISQKGSVNADSAVVGENGKIFFKAKKDITLDAGSTTSANGPQGGQIIIQSESGTSLVSGTLAATGSDGKGGDIQVLGNHVGLIDNAQVDASGKTGGGTVLIGGDYLGKNPDIQNATATYFGKDAKVMADATESGDGGKVIVWADDATRFYGSINARGGWFGGDGGFVETSGKQYLAALGTVDISARLGNGGLWFLDPNNITIQTAGPDTYITGTPNFTTTNDSAILTIASITGVLNAGGNVSVTTGTAGTNAQLGDITLADPINSSSTGSSTLTLTANNNINVNANINNYSSMSPLNVTLTATNGAITGNGALVGSQLGWLNATLNAKTGINLTGSNQVSAAVLSTSTGAGAPIVFNNALGIVIGDFNVSGTSSGSFTVTAGTGSGNIVVNNNLSAGGVISLTAKGDITVAKPITYSGVGASTLTLAADRNIVINGTGSISGSSGNPLSVILNSDRNTIANGAIAMLSGTSIKSFGGDITLGGGQYPDIYDAVGNSTYPNGVSLTNAVIESGAGFIKIRGTSIAGIPATNSGIYIDNTGTGSFLTSTSGNITLVGRGGAGSGVYNNKYGIRVQGTIQSTSGTIGLGGTGGDTSSSNYGIYLDNGVISTLTGAGINLTGNGGQGGMSNNIGINLAGGSITSTSAPITITGNAGISNSMNSNYGVLLGAGTAGLSISSVSGAITIDGTAGGGSGYGAEGIRVLGGQATPLPVNIISTGSAPISLTGTGTDVYPSIYLSGGYGSVTIGGASASGDISFAAGGATQDISISSGVTIQSTGKLFLKPVTPATTIGIGGGTGTFTLTAAELGSLAEGFSNITIGSATQAALINVNVATFKDNLTLLAPATGGAISITGDGSGSLTSTGHNITLTSASTVTGGDIFAASLNANAATGITLTGGVGTVTLVNSGAGNVQYNNVGTNPVTVNGNNGGGSFTVYSWNGGDINIGLIDNGTGYLDIQTYDNINNALSGTSTNIIGGTLNLYATYMLSASPTGIGGNGSALNTKVGILDVDNKTGTVNISNTSTLLTIGTVNNSGGLIILNNTGALTTGSNAMNAGGNISVKAGGSLTISTGGVVSTGGDVLLEAAANSGTGNLTIGGPVSSTAAGNVNLKGDNVAVNDNLSASGGIVSLTANGAITELSTKTITATTLKVTNTTGATTLDQNNAVAKLGLIDSTGGDFKLKVSGALVVDDNLNATGRVVNLTTGGAITETSGKSITASELLVSTPGNVSLTGNNMVNKLAANMPYTGSLAFSNAKALAIDTVAGTNGINFNNNYTPINITTTAGNLTVNQPILSDAMGGSAITLTSAGLIDIQAAVTSTSNSTPAGSVKLVAGTGGITSNSTSGIVTASTLEAISGGGVTLNANNNVNTLAGNVTGSGFQYADANGFSVGTVNTVGLTVANGDISLKAGGLNSLLTVSQPVKATTGNVSYIADNFAHNATTTTGTTGNYAEVKPSTAATNIQFSASADAAGYLRLSSAELGYFSTPLLKVGNSTVTGSIAIMEPVAPGALNALSLITGGAITQGTGSTITIANLNADGWQGVSLNEANAITNLGGHTNAGNFAFSDVNAINVGLVDVNNGIAVSTSGNISLTAGGSIAQSGGALLTTPGSMTVTAATGINLTNANTAPAVTLSNTASGNVTYSTSIAALAISASNAATGNIDIANTGGTLNVSSASTGSGGIALNGSGNVSLTTASTSGSVNVTSSGGSILDGNAVGATNITGGIVTLNASTGIASDVNAATSVAAQTTTGNITLASTSNLPIAAISAAGTVSLTANTSTISDANGATLNITANSATLSSYAGIGITTDPIEMQTSTLSASNSMGGGVFLSNTGALSISSMSALAGDIRLNNSGQLSLLGIVTGNNINLITSSAFINSYGAGALSASGRWLVWSVNPSADTRGGLAYGFKQYNAQYGVTSVLGSGNGFLYSVVPTTLSASLTGSVTKTYDGTTAATLTSSNYSVSGAIDSDTVVLNNPTAGAYDTKNFGSGKTVTVSGITATATNGGAPVYGYSVNGGASAAIGTIGKAGLTLTPVTDAKVYDGTVASTAVVTVAGKAAGDTVTVAEQFSSKNVLGTNGSTLVIKPGYTILDGSNADMSGNYTVTDTATAAGTISKAGLTLTPVTDAKVYDGTVASTAVVSVAGKAAGDTVTAAEQFSSKNVLGTNGSTLVIKPGYTILDGSNADMSGNYTVTDTATAVGTISKASLTISATGISKPYDSLTGATVTLTDNRVAGDILTSAYANAAYLDKNVATSKTVNVSGITLSNTDAGNYTFNTSTTTTADITPAPLTLSTGSVTKTYDGTLTAAGTAVVAGGTLFSGDTLSGGTFAFTDKNVGIGNKIVTTAGVTVGDGVNNSNYNVSYADNTISTINPYPVSLTGSRTYNGTVDVAAGVLTLGPLVSTPAFYETLTLTGIGTMADKNVGTGKTVNVSGLVLGNGYSGGIGGPPIFIGGLASNYTFTGGTQTVDIAKAAIANVTGITANSRTYDGTTNATLVTTGAAFTNMVAGDILNVSAATAAFRNKNAEVGKTVDITGIALGGTDAGNYTLTSNIATTTADISKAAIANVTGITAKNKTYDGTTSATLVTTGAAFTNMIAGDSLNVSAATGAFLDKHVATGKAVNISGIALGGIDSGNYTLTSATAATTADITARPITITAATNTKGYDRTTSAAALPTITTGSLATGDAFTTLSEVYDSKLAGTGKTLTPSAVIADGNNGSNYLVTLVNNTTGVIEPGQTISGMLDVAGSGRTINFAVNGALLPDAAATDAGGNYSVMLPLNTIPNDNALLTYVANDSSVKSASVYYASGGNIAGLALSSNTLTIGGAKMSNTILGTAKGALADSDIPYAVSAANLTLTPNFSFKTASGTAYSLEGNITTTNASQTYSGPLALLGNAALNAGTGKISFGAPVTGLGYNLNATGGDIALGGHINVGTGSVTLKSDGAIINGMGSALSITAASLNAEAVNGIGHGDPLMTAVNNLTALNTTTNNIEIDNVGVILVSDLKNLGTGDVIFQNIGAITTGDSTVTSSGGSVALTAHSPLTIGKGGVSASGSVSLMAAPSADGADNLTINGTVASTNGSIVLKAGTSLVLGPGSSFSAPHGTVTVNDAPAGNAAATGNETATDNTVSSLVTVMAEITSVEKKDTVVPDDKSGDEEELKKKSNTGGDKKTDDKKTDDNAKKYCN